jgi:hypothetical protein
MAYDTFCEAFVGADRETAISIECKCEGWYKASESILIPAIKEKEPIATSTTRQKQPHQQLTCRPPTQAQNHQQMQPRSCRLGQSTLV